MSDYPMEDSIFICMAYHIVGEMHCEAHPSVVPT
jgi:hypothetical protein